MKRYRLILTIVMLVLIVALLSFGVYSLVKSNLGVANSTVFESGNDNVFVKISAEYDGPQLQSEYAENSTYGFTLDQAKREAYQDQQVPISPWNLGRTDFSTQNTKITLTFTFENLNSEYDLAVDISNVAFDSEGKFATSYASAINESDLVTVVPTTIQSSSNVNVATIPQFVVEKNGKIVIQLTYELKKFDKEFAFTNNISVLLTALVEEE